MERRLLKKIFALGLTVAMTFASVPFISEVNGAVDAEADDSTGSSSSTGETSEGTVDVEYTVQVNQTSSIINDILGVINKARTSTTHSASDSSTQTVKALTYNNVFEDAAITRAEEIALFNPGNGTRPNGKSEDSLIPEGTNVTCFLTYTGAYNSSPASEWAENSKVLDPSVQSAAIGHVTYNNNEYYCIILSKDTSKTGADTIGTGRTRYVDPVKGTLSYSNIGNIYAAYSYDKGATYYNPIQFNAGNGSCTASLGSTIADTYKQSAAIPTIKYLVSTKTTSGTAGTQTYDLAGVTPKTSVKDSTGTSSTGLTVNENTVTGNAVGSYNVVYEATVAGKKTLFSIPVTVTSADLSGASISFTDGKTYYANGTAAEPDVTVTLNGTPLTKGTDYTVKYDNNTPATSVTTNQTAIITVKGTGNYIGSAKKTFTIYPANGGSLASATITVNEKNITYDGKEKKPKITVTLQGVTVPEASYSVKYANNIKAGTANIIVTAKNGDQRYTGVAKGTFTIAKADLASADFTFSDSDNKSNTNPQYSYTGADIKPEPGIKVGSETLTKDTDFTYSYSNNRAIGTTATVTITGKGNYTGTAFAYFEITKGNISKVTVTPTPSAFTYNGQRQYPAVVVVSIGTHQLIQGTDYTLSAYPNSVDAGTYNFTVTGINNFKGTTTSTTSTTTSTTTTSTSSGSTTTAIGTITGRYTINAKNVNDLYKKTNGISVSSVSTKTYTGKAIKPSITVTDDALGTVLSSSTDYTRTDSDNTNPGTAKISLEFKGNYTGTITISYKILPKKTTVKKVTAGKKKATVTYSKISGVTGYQVKCGTNRVVTKSTKTKNTTKTKYTMKSLKKGKRYYFKVRTYYTTSSGTKVYSSWSNVKSAKVK